MAADAGIVRARPAAAVPSALESGRWSAPAPVRRTPSPIADRIADPEAVRRESGPVRASEPGSRSASLPRTPLKASQTAPPTLLRPSAKVESRRLPAPAQSIDESLSRTDEKAARTDDQRSEKKALIGSQCFQTRYAPPAIAATAAATGRLRPANTAPSAFSAPMSRGAKRRASEAIVLPNRARPDPSLPMPVLVRPPAAEAAVAAPLASPPARALAARTPDPASRRPRTRMRFARPDVTASLTSAPKSSRDRPRPTAARPAPTASRRPL